MEARSGVALTNRALWRHGAPVVPVSGELHYSRVPRARWRTRLRQMRAGGVTVVATYVFWLHHEPTRGAARFDGNLDVAAFTDLCAEEGLDLILRIGPWCHGETRNGGFPDWVQHAAVGHRTDDPGYLALVREWFGQLGGHLDGRTFLGIQVENELYDQPRHLVTLKSMAREAGMTAPLWTATAWGGASLPETEVMPLYGGYGDGFWVDADAPWDPTFRAHYFFSHVWDDPGIGADLRKDKPSSLSPLSTLFPPATAELGGGMATAYHRRPRPTALDVATIAHCKIGNGSAWQGYYMYAGGTNPPGTHESHETGYPNDLQRLGYDFHAPIGEAGVLGAGHALLRQQHAFLAAFGATLTEMPSTLPSVVPAGVDDSTTLRWALRSDGTSGFLFVAWHQPHVPLPLFRGAQFEVSLGEGETVVVPSAPVDIPAGTLARWPLRLTLAGVRLDWVTASAVTVLPGPTLVLTASAGVPVTYAVDGVVCEVTPSRVPVRVGDLDLLVLPADDADLLWVSTDDSGGRRLLLSAAELTWDPSGRVTAAGPDVLAYDPAARAFAPLSIAGPHPVTGSGVVAVEREGGRAVPVSYGKFDGRESAPGPDAFDELAAVYRVELPDWAADPALDARLVIGWAGDVGELRVDGRTVTDRFWDGSEWAVNLRDAGYRAGSELRLHLLPLAAGSPVWLPEDARERLLGSDGQLLALDYVRVTGRVSLEEAG